MPHPHAKRRPAAGKARAAPSAAFKGRRTAARKTTRRTARRAPKVPIRSSSLMKQAPLRIPECTQNYFVALYDPWMVPQGICIPSNNFPLPSQKIKCFLRGQFVLGTTGHGYVVITPSTTNTGQCLTFTTATSVGTEATVLGSFTNLGGAQCLDLPYSNTQLVTNKEVAARIAAVGCRVRYAGRSDQRSGIYASLEEPDHASTNALVFQDVQQQYANATTTRPSPNADWDAAVTYSGATATYMVDFVNLTNPISAVATGGGSPMCITCQGLAGDIIEFEYAIHVEYLGRIVSGRSPSHADPATYGNALRQAKSDAASGSLTKAKIVPGFKNFLSSVWDSLPSLGGLATAAITSIATENPVPLLIELASEVGSALTAPAAPRRSSSLPLRAAAAAIGL